MPAESAPPRIAAGNPVSPTSVKKVPKESCVEPSSVFSKPEIPTVEVSEFGAVRSEDPGSDGTEDFSGDASWCSAAEIPVNLLPTLPAGSLEAWTVAMACRAWPDGSVVCGGRVKGLGRDALADAPAYWYIAAASWAHISAY